MGLFGWLAPSVAQPVFQNPSFEGAPVAGAAPPGWFICTGSPDVLPGFWGTTQTPSHGNSFLGFHHEESVAANFTGGIGSCSQMTFEMDVSIVPLNLPGNSYWMSNNQGVNPGYICIYGGYSSCDNSELLWQSPLITNVLTWETLLITLNPSQNYTYLNIVPCVNPQGTYTYFGIDNIVVIDQNPLVNPIPDQAHCEGEDIAIDLTGGYSSGAAFAWTGPNGFTSTDEDILITNAALSNGGQYTVVVTDNGCASEPMSTQATVVDCTPNVTCNLICNTDFEDQQVITAGNFTLVNHSSVPCWSTTASDQQVEVWGTGFNGVPAYSGNQFIELNANLVSTIYQDFQALPGSTVDIFFAHRGRSGTDVMSVSVGPLGGPYTNLGTFSTGNTAWMYYTVSYTFPAIPQVDYSLRFNSISAAGGNPGVGNFLDDISIIMPQIVVDAVVSEPTCLASSDGTIEITVSGGTPPYNVLWDAPISSSNTQVTNLSEGTYSYNVTDLYGCIFDGDVTLIHQFVANQSTATPVICQGEEYVLPDGQITTTTGTYVVTISTVNGCDSVITTNLTVNPTFASNLNPSICDGETFLLPSGVSVGTAGTYSDTLQTILGCDSVISTNLTVNPSPVVNLPASICTGQSYLAQGALQTTSGTYYDTLTTAFGCDSVIITDLAIIPMPIHTIDTLACVGDSVLTGGYWKSVPGSYNDTLQTALGCDSLVITNLSNHPQPTAAISVTNSCLDEPLMVNDASIISGGSITSWSWDFGNGNTSLLQQPLPQNYLSAGNYTLGLVVTSNNGCIDSTETVVEIYPLPIVLFAFDSVCHGLQIQFTDQSTAVGTYSLTQWSWLFSDSQTSSQQNPQVTFANPGSYSSLLTITNSAGCKADTMLGDAFVYPNPDAVILQPLGHCLYDTVSFFEAATVDGQWGDAIISYSWELESGTTTSLQSPAHVYQTSGVHSVQLTVETANGCTDVATATVETYARPEVAFSLSDYEGCEPLSIYYQDGSTIASPYSVTFWNWELGHGEISNVAQPSFTHMYNGADGILPDTLDVALSAASAQGCASLDTARSTVLVYPLPKAAFTSDRNEATMVNPTIQFIDGSSENVTNRHWAFGDGQISSVVNPEYAYNDTGRYLVELNVLTAYGCEDETTGEIIIYPHFSYYVPNSFTPNDNRINDRFRGFGEGFTNEIMYIYNRWGEEIYYNAAGQGWDGTYKGKQVELAVYVYHISVTDWEGNVHQFRGHLSLLR